MLKQRLKERGSTLVLYTVAMVGMMGMAALAIDLGMLRKARAEAQRAADAAALAGASAFQADISAAAKIDSARTRAYRAADTNYMNGVKFDTTAGEITVWVIPESVKVRVKARRASVPTWFARVFGIRGLPVGAIAAAEASDEGSGAACPLAVTMLVAFEQAGPARFPEPPPLNPGTSSIHGRVVDALSGQPIERAEVVLMDSKVEQTKEVAGRTITTRHFVRVGKTLTASDGSYGFDDISDGAYRLFVTHRSYLPSCSGSSGGPRSRCDINVIADQRVNDAHVSLPRGAIIRGRLLDQQGRPIAGASLSTEFKEASLNSGGARSGVDGRFEIPSVPPGTMVIRVDPAGGWPMWHRTMYYPGVHARADALPITVEAGATSEIEIRARDTPVGTIRTTLSGPRGFRVQQMTLTAPNARMLVNMTVSNAGTAVVTDLSEGRYVIAARARAGSRTLAAYQLIIIGVGEYEVPMRLEPTARVKGRVVVDTGGVPPVGGVSVAAHWVSGKLRLDSRGPDRIAVRRNGSFTIEGLFGRRQFELFGLSDQWRVVAVRAGRADVTSGIDLAAGSSTDITIVVSKR